MTNVKAWADGFAVAQPNENLVSPTISPLKDGRLLMVWGQKAGAQGDHDSVWARIFNADGSASSAAFKVNDAGSGKIGEPSVAVLTNGGFVITFDQIDGTSRNLVWHRYDADGSSIGESSTPRNLKDFAINPSIAALTDGGFVITCQNASMTESFDGLGHLIFDGEGVKIKDFTADKKGFSSSTTLALGGSDDAYVTVYERDDDKYGFEIHKGDGTLKHAFRQVTAEADSKFYETSLALLDTGDFVVAWDVPDLVTGKKFRVFSADGTPKTDEIVFDETPRNATAPSVTSLPGGHFAVAYDDAMAGVHVKVFDAAGELKQEFTAASGQSAASPVVSTLSDGRFAIGWTVGKAFLAQIFDTRESGEDWTGPDSGVQHAGTDLADHLHGGAGSDRLYGWGGSDFLFGHDGHDTVLGGRGDDWLDGGAGEDVLDGESGWDVASYLTMSIAAGGIVVDLATGDAHGAAAGDTLVGIEVVQGTNSDDTLTDRHEGGELLGEGGNDRLVGLEGGDKLRGGAGDDSLAGGAGRDELYGGAGNNVLEGGAGADFLDGTGGWGVADYSHAAADAAGHGVTVDLSSADGKANGGDEAAGDRFFNINGVMASAHSDVLLGNGNGNWMIGGDGADRVYGGAGGDSLHGSAGNDVMTGGAGGDRLDGGEGIDTAAFAGAVADYAITKNADGTLVVEDKRLNRDGTDHLTSIEFLRFSDGVVKPDNHAPAQIVVTGGTIAENAAIGTVVAGITATDPDGDAVTLSLVSDPDGKFRLEGDNLVLANALDYEVSAQHRVTLKATDPYGGESVREVVIGVTDVAEQVGTGGEPDVPTPGNPNPDPSPDPSLDPSLVLYGTPVSDTLTGTTGNDAIWGLGSHDVLRGAAGNDWLCGGRGKDRLWGGDGRDIFVFDARPNKKTNIDKIMDFNVADDTVNLAKGAFTKIAKKGVLVGSAFHAGEKAHDASDRIIYNKKTGALFYDNDGTGAHAAVKIASLSKNLKMTAADFFVV